MNSVEKAFRVQQAFQPNRRRLSLSQISLLAEIGMSAAQRFTHTLLQLDLLQKNPGTKIYELSPRLLNVTYQYISANELVSRGTPSIQRLSVEMEETVNITTLDGPEALEGS